MLENAHKYGFILRFPEGKEKITGFNAEAWHFRYVGEEVATFIYNNNLTYEEYVAMYM
jgi:D-alanyl-D-alanine carboxypeptidase